MPEYLYFSLLFNSYDVNNCCYFARGGDPFGTQLPDKFAFKSSYWHYRLLISQQFVIRNLMDIYVKDIL